MFYIAQASTSKILLNFNMSTFVLPVVKQEMFHTHVQNYPDYTKNSIQRHISSRIC